MDDRLPRGTLPPSLSAALIAWAHTQRCSACDTSIDVRDGVVVTLLVPARGALRLYALKPGETPCADGAAPTAIAVHPRCAVRVADDAGSPSTADAIRTELLRGAKCRE